MPIRTLVETITPTNVGFTPTQTGRPYIRGHPVQGGSENMVIVKVGNSSTAIIWAACAVCAG